MATNDFLTTVSLCLNKAQAERHDRSMCRKQHHAEAALFNAWLQAYQPHNGNGESFDFERISIARDEIHTYVRGKTGREHLKRHSLKRFVSDVTHDWSWVNTPNYDETNWEFDFEDDTSITTLCICGRCAADGEGLCFECLCEIDNTTFPF